MEIDKKVGLMLYWCEGDKRGWMVAVTSTDVSMLKYFIKWADKYYNISIDRMTLRLHIWEDTNEEKVKKYWSKQTGITRFTKSWIKPTGKNKKYPFGICRISFNNTKIHKQIMNEIESLWCI